VKDESKSRGEYAFIRYEHVDHVVRITLNRPEVLNAIHPPMAAELEDAWLRLKNDEEAWIGILAGAGGRAFSAGADLKWRAALGDRARTAEATAGSGEARAHQAEAEEPVGFWRGRGLFKPLIAAIDGYAIGGGLELAMACDIIVASEEAQFGLPEPRRGLMAAAGGVHRLVRRLPLTAAMGMLLTGKLINAEEAHRVGLVNEVVPADQLEESVERWTEDILSCSPLAVQAAKEAALEGLEMPMREAEAQSFPFFAKLTQSVDFIEGSQAFAQKREPVWKGK